MGEVSRLRECWWGLQGWFCKQVGKGTEGKIAEVEEGIVGGECKGACKNKKGGEKLLVILQRTQHALY